jgi:thymidylate kinase
MVATRAALVGIDGAGKSTLVRDLRTHTNVAGDVVTLHTPEYCQVPDAPLGHLSRHLDAASRIADRLGSFALKALVLYLQMTLYGPIERFLVDTYRPGWVISDRHPVVDSIVYGHLYRRLIPAVTAQPPDWKDTLPELLEAESPGGYAALTAWIAVQARRHGSNADPYGLLREVMTVFDQPTRKVISELAARYQARLPDLIFLIDVEPREALRRSRCSHEMGELHENRVYLKQLQARYEQVLSLLQYERPRLVVHRVPNPDGDCAAALAAIVEHLSEASPRRHGNLDPTGRFGTPQRLP